MRMWLVPPQLMCDQHLLGEHLEMHMFIGTIRKIYQLMVILRKGYWILVKLFSATKSLSTKWLHVV